MNGCSKQSISPWSAEENGGASELSESLDTAGYCRMPYPKMRDDGSYGTNVILKKICKDIGFLNIACKKFNPYGMTYTKSSFPKFPCRTKAENTLRKYEPYKPKGTPRYSRIDKFIEGLNEACTRLPKPLIEDFGRTRPHTVAVQSQPKREMGMIPVRPASAQANSGERRNLQDVDKEDSENAEGPIESGLIPVPRVIKANTCTSTETGPRKIAEEDNRDYERQGACTVDSAFERKKRELVRAATMVQSRYRAYKVRRSQPLKYMHMIGNAKAKLEELKQQFNTWKIAVCFPTNSAERLSMTEEVMKLLMKLDSMQDVPLYILEFRKSVAGEIYKFQEEVDAFLRQKTKHGPLLALTGNERRPNSATERRTGNRNVNGSACSNQPPNSLKTSSSSKPKTESQPINKLSLTLNLYGLDSAAKGDNEDHEEEHVVQREQLEPEINGHFCPELVLQPRGDHLLGPQPPVEPHDGSSSCSEVLQPRGDSPLHSQPSVENHVGSYSCPEVLQPRGDSLLCPQPSVEPQVGSYACPGMSVEVVLGSENEIARIETNQQESVELQTCDIFIPVREDSSRTSRKKTYGVRFKDDVNVISGIQSCSLTENSLESSNGNLRSHDAPTVKFADQNYVTASFSEDTERKEVAGIHECRDVAKPEDQESICLTTDAGDGAVEKEGNDIPISTETFAERVPATELNTGTIHVHIQDPCCVDTIRDVDMQGRFRYQGFMSDRGNASVKHPGSFRVGTILSKSRFCNEQLQLRACSTDWSIRTPGSHAISETGDAPGKYEFFHPRASKMEIPSLPLQQKQMVTFVGDNTELRPVLKSPRSIRSCDDFKSMRIPARNGFDERPTSAEAEAGNGCDAHIDAFPAVQNVSCCSTSDCARPGCHHPRECWRPNVSTGEGERLTYNEYPGEVQEEYVLDDYFQPPERAESSSFDHRELRYLTDPYTSKLRRARQAAQVRSAKNDLFFCQRENGLPPRATTAGQDVPKAYVHKATSYTPSPQESICSEAEKSFRRSRSHLPYRQMTAAEERRYVETDEGHDPDAELVTKLVDDNKRLKGLLKDVMHWNKAQATAMVSMSERIQHLEGLDILP